MAGRKNRNITQKNLNISVPESYYIELNKVAQEQDKTVSEVVRGYMETFLLPKIYHEPSLMYGSSDNYIEELRGGTIEISETIKKFQQAEQAGKYALNELEEFARKSVMEVTCSVEKKKETK